MRYGHRTEGVSFTLRDVSRILSHTNRVNERSFKSTVITLTCVAFLVSLGRIFYNKRHNTRLFLDDALLIVAILCLIIETGCVSSFEKSLYLIDASALHVASSRWTDIHMKLEGIKLGQMVASSVFAWASIFGVKFSCLAFCNRVSGNTSGSLRMIFRAVLGATTVSGLIIFILLFVQCPDFDRNPIKCVARESWAPSLGIAIVEQVLNITTTLMIASLFLLQFRQIDFRFERKTTITIATVLSLCCICVALGIARASGGIHQNVNGVKQISVVWNSLLLHCEAAITILTGSVATVHRQSQNRASLYATGESDLSMSFTSRIKSAGALILPKRTAAKQAQDTQDMIGDQHTSWPAPGQDFGTPRLSIDDFRSSLQGSRCVPSGDIADERADQIRVTVECTITSEEASLSELEHAREEAVAREWNLNDDADYMDTNVVAPPGGLNVNTMEGLDPALLGMITSGIRG